MTRRPFLIFDAYGTLVELDDFYGHLQRNLARAGWHFSPEEIRAAAHREMKHYIDRSMLARDRASWLALRAECAQVLADSLREARRDFSLSIEKCTEVLGDSIHFRVFPEARRVLESLHARGVSMGVLSNWDYELPRILESVGIKKYFAFVLSSAEIGESKPSPKVFERALQMARGVRPQLKIEECVYIGDHWEKDVLPAKHAGWTPLWLVRSRRDLPSKSDSDGRADKPSVQRLKSLRPLLRLWRSNFES